MGASSVLYLIVVFTMTTAPCGVLSVSCPENEPQSWLPSANSAFQITLNPPMDGVDANTLFKRTLKFPVDSQLVIQRSGGGVFRPVKLCLKTKRATMVNATFTYNNSPIIRPPLPTVNRSYTVLATKVFRRRCFDLSPQEGSTEPGISRVVKIEIAFTSAKINVKVKKLRMKGCLQIGLKG